MRWLRTRRDVVLLYHAVGLAPATGDPDNLYVDTATFRRQLAYIRRRADVVPLRELASSRRSGPRQRVAVTIKPEGFRAATHYFNDDSDIARLVTALDEMRDKTDG